MKYSHIPLNILAHIDPGGAYGSYLHYAMAIFFVGSAMLAFIYFWRKGRLDMDEEPKNQMMRDDE